VILIGLCFGWFIWFTIVFCIFTYEICKIKRHKKAREQAERRS